MKVSFSAPEWRFAQLASPPTRMQNTARRVTYYRAVTPPPLVTADLVPTALFEQAARRFRMLGEPVRLAILNVLHTRGEAHVQDIVAATGQSQANVSKHLRLLLDERLVGRRQEGLFAFYRITDPTLAGLCVLVCGALGGKDGPGAGG